MDYNEIATAVKSRAKAGMEFGTERTRALLDGLSSPDEHLKIIHIAGSNGKGSVAEYLAQILLAAGKTVGKFSSPAVYAFEEQVEINGSPVSCDLFQECVQKTLSLGINATEFEYLTAAALFAFYKSGCEYAVVECGLGGTYDATNAVLHKKLALLTSISLEHTAILGSTVKDICAHKAGIIKDCPAIISAYNSGEVLSYFKALGATVADKPVEVIKSNPDGNLFLYGGYGFETRLAGDCQPYNAALAIEGARMLGLPVNAIYTGVKSAKLGGRLEVIRAGGTSYILDGAHNPACFKPLAGLLRRTDGQKRIIYGCLSDKDTDGNLAVLSGITENISAVIPQSPRAMDLDKIYMSCKKYFKNADSFQTVSRALENAKEQTVAVCGSFTLLKEAKTWIEKRS